MEMEFDAGVEPALVRRGAKRVSAMWEERADQTDVSACPDTAGECCDRDAVIRVMSKCRTRQLEPCNTSSAFFHAWLQRAVQMKSPKDPRLSDGRRWQLARAFFPLSPGVSTQWSPGGVHTATDVEVR